MFSIAGLFGAILGWFVWHIPGALLGYAVGMYFERAYRQFNRHYNPETRQAVEAAFFHSVFPLLGRMAKADGRISESEIASAEQLMSNMRLAPEVRKQAIELFQSGANSDFQIDQALQEFMSVCGPYPDLKQILLVYLISMAISDGHIHQAESEILEKVTQALGYPKSAFEHLLRMAQAQNHFHSQTNGQAASEQSLELAYQALGVEPTISDADLKKAYRKLMSQYHPDKLTGQGVPEEMIKVATERSQEIQAAYDLIKKSRSAQ